jgi:hypothetical protein
MAMAGGGHHQYHHHRGDHHPAVHTGLWRVRTPYFEKYFRFL